MNSEAGRSNDIALLIEENLIFVREDRNEC